MKIKNKKDFPVKKKLLLIFAIMVVIVGIGLYAKISHLWPFSESSLQSDEVPSLPKFQQPTDKVTPSDSPAGSIPTKTEGKTPSQYEGEKLEDTPDYNNEQFRIPEGE